MRIVEIWRKQKSLPCVRGGGLRSNSEGLKIKWNNNPSVSYADSPLLPKGTRGKGAYGKGGFVKRHPDYTVFIIKISSIVETNEL